jgi:signal transduction histidine kinase
MGSTFEREFPGLYDSIIREVMEKAEQRGVSQDMVEIPLFPVRNGFLEETYFTGAFTPIRNLDGKVGGFYQAVKEVTRQKINERRMAMFNYVIIPSALEQEDLAYHVMSQLESNGRDVTMALLYEIDEEIVPGTSRVFLHGNIGFPKGHPLAVEEADLNDSVGLIPLFREAKNKVRTYPVDERFEGVQWRGFDEPSSSFSIIPLSAAGRTLGYLVIGANPRRPLDEDYQQFLWHLETRITSIAASIVSAGEKRRRSEQLEKELSDTTRQIQYMAQHASVGLRHLSLDGNVSWANEQYFQIVRRSKEATDYKHSFLDELITEDRPKAMEAWERVTRGEPNVTMELRLKHMFIPPCGDPEPAFILMVMFPYIEKGEVKSIMACITDISQLKWAKSVEQRKAADAEAARRKQEEFIDIVSHEMRNPLSAIFQCVDMIQSSMVECEKKGQTKEALLEALRSNIDNSGVILLCAQHQKRIVDDVLTLSKLEHMLLKISPRPTQLAVLIERAVRMFELDLQSQGFKVTINPESSLRENSVDWVLCDPSRVAQIVINLLTNAMKFTRAEPKREITISYGATLSEPRNAFQAGMTWAPSEKEVDDLTLEPDWGTGEQLYLVFSISDTGVGMTPEEVKKLFHRFKQASTRTSIRYGGSGLGLFISQKLTEKHAGEIGVASAPGEGTTFAFYVKGRRIGPENAEFASITQPAQSSRPELVKSQGEKSNVELDKIHVLLVEDNIINQKLLRKQLVNAGCVVYTANNGVEALQFLGKSDIWREQVADSKRLDIILMDWEMPVMDGLTCSREIRALQESGQITRHVQIIAITANAREEQIQNAYKSGMVCSQHSLDSVERIC